MLECPSINRNSKLYQKFLEKKGKKEIPSSSPLCQSIEVKERTSQSTNQSQSLKTSMNNSGNDDLIEAGNQVIQKNQIQQGQDEISRQPNLDELLKRQLSKKRSSTFVNARRIEPFQLYPQQNRPSKQPQIQRQLENEYLTSENERLKLKLTQQVQKYQIIQLDLDKQRKRSRQLQQQLLLIKRQMKSQENAKTCREQIYSQEIDKLRVQNNLAKDYLYKLTLKLYQSQQQNQRLLKQIAQIKDSQSKTTQQIPAQQQHVPKSVRQRQFQNYKPEGKYICQNQQTLTTSLQSIRPASKQNRILQIKAQLQQLNLLKVFNGKNRRRKIELERELQELNSS